MTTVKLYNGEVTIEFDELEHIYYKQHPTKGPTIVPGVTTPLKLLDKPALVPWAASQAVNYITNWWVESRERGDDAHERTVQFLAVCDDAKREYRRLSRDAANIGSMVHDFAERTLKGETVKLPQDPQVAAGCKAFLAWQELHKIEPIHLERIVFSKQWYYCGTVDFYGKIDGELCVVDFKTSSGLYLEMMLQLAGYAVALEEEFEKNIDVGWVVRLDKKTGRPDCYRIKLIEHNEHGEVIFNLKEDFIAVRQLYTSLKKAERKLDAIRKAA
jgi:hypothetical protein